MISKNTKSVTDEIKEKILELLCRMSPENITCDGELNKTQVTQRMQMIRKDWRAVEKEAGRKISLEEANQWEWDKLTKDSSMDI